MQEIMRKHRRVILVLMLLFIGLPFVFLFGMPSIQNDSQVSQEEVATVGGVPISEAQYRQALDRMAEMMAQGKPERPTYKEMVDSQMTENVLKQLVDSALITLQENNRNMTVDTKVLQKQIREWKEFQDEQGNFNAEAYNDWVTNTKDWEPLYAQMRESLSRQIYMNAMLSIGNRVSDRAIDKELEADGTKLNIKYVRIDPPVTPTDEQIQKQFDENQEKYRRPPTNTADFVAISLAPEVPQKALDAVKEAREGADFAELVKKYSDLTSPGGDDLGWRPVEENPVPQMAPLYALAVGQVSDPVPGPTGFHVYKVEEERTNPDTNTREVHGRQIIVNAALTEEERAAREAKAELVSSKAKQSDLATAAQENGLTVQRAAQFTSKSMEIENVPLQDVPLFRSAISSQKDDQVFKPVRARGNIYVGKVVESVPGDVPPLDEVRTQVTNDVINTTKRTDEYKKQVEALTEKIKAEAKSIDEIPAKFPDLKAEVKQTDKPFTRKDNLFQQQVYMNTVEIFDSLGKAEPGTMAGPLQGMLGDQWFVQLVERTGPTDEDKAKWPEERKKLREQMAQRASYEVMADFTQDLRERMLAEVSVRRNEDVISRVLGVGKYAPKDEKPVEEVKPDAAAAPAADASAPAAAPAPATAPAAEAPAPAAAAPAAAPAADAAAPAEVPAAAPETPAAPAAPAQ
jgi:parvulin-like peptidyl-prolyl isomerase